MDPIRDLEQAAELDRAAERPAPRRAAVLEGEAREWGAERSFAALRDVACAVTSNLNLRSLVIQILDIAIQAVGAERGIIFMGNPSDRELVPMVARSIRGQEVHQLERISHTILRHSQLGRAVVTEDATRDPMLHAVPSVQIQQIRSVICLPMMVRGDSVGAIYVDSPSRAQAFPAHAERFLEAFASLAAVALENARLHGETLHENARLRRQLSAQEAFGRLVTISPTMIALLKRISMLVPSDAPVMVVGESGTGKELIARSIHEAGARMLNPFVAYNCAAIPRDLMESIFFGHVRGAFTGAVRAMPGLFRQADQGTLFLDEILELDPALQAKLLRVIEDGVIRPLGSHEEFRVDVRLIAATSRDIRAAVREGRFREELFYRINVIELQVPPLRERLEDVPVLIDHFLRKHGTARSEGRQVSLTPDAVAYLQTLPWRGNVRELENLVRRILVLCEPGPVDAERVSRLIGSASSDAGIESAPPAMEELARSQEDEEKKIILGALHRARGNRTRAARMLNMHRNALLRRMQKLGIETP